jgi:hypothetical protein
MSSELILDTVMEWESKYCLEATDGTQSRRSRAVP